MASTSIFQAMMYRLKFWNKQAAKQVSNAEIEGEINIDDAQKELFHFESQVRDLVATNKGIERQRDAAQLQFADLDKAAKAIKAKLDGTDPADAKYATYQSDLQQAATYAVSARDQIKSLDTTIAGNIKTIEGLKVQISDYQTMISDSKNKFTQLKARNTSAKIQQELNEAKNGLSDNGHSALSKLKEFEQAVQEQEDKAAASTEMNESSAAGTADRLINEYGSGSKGASVDDYITNLTK